MLGILFAMMFVVLNGLFVAAEFALVKLSATYGNRSGRHPQIDDAIRKLDRYLAVSQLGITLASLGLGWIGEPTFERLIAGALESLGIEVGPAARKSLAFGLAFTIMTWLHVILGEQVPKLIAIHRSEPTALATVWALRAVDIVFRPMLWLLDVSSRLILGSLGLSSESHSEARLSEEEILGVLAAQAARGEAGEAKRQLFERVIRFSERTAKVAMIPRMDVVAIPITSSGGDAIEKLRESEYSRMPVSSGRELDQIVGYVYAKDLLLDPEARRLTDLTTIRRDVLFVPETQRLIDVLRNMQRKQTPFAIVVDEYGGTSGILTMEDLLEEIVGDIHDEFDRETPRIQAVEGGWEVDGAVTLDELAVYGVSPGAEERLQSVAAAVAARLGRLPRLGDRAEIGGRLAEVTALSRRRVTRVRIAAVL